MKDEIVCGDFLELIKNMPDKSVDAVITDPPYQQEAHDRGIAKKKKHFEKMMEWTNINNDFYREEVLNEYVRVCKFPNIFLFCGKRDLYKSIQYAVKLGLEYHIIPVCKKNPLPFVNNTWLSLEFGVHITDRKLVYTKDYETKIPYFLLSCGGNKKETDHPNEKDLDMVKRIVRNITKRDDLVLDCFMGSGTTAVACLETERHYIGFEQNEEYVKQATKRIDEHKREPLMFSLDI